MPPKKVRVQAPTGPSSKGTANPGSQAAARQRAAQAAQANAAQEAREEKARRLANTVVIDATQHPANSFVTLHTSPDKLKALGYPAVPNRFDLNQAIQSESATTTYSRTHISPAEGILAPTHIYNPVGNNHYARDTSSAECLETPGPGQSTNLKPSVPAFSIDNGVHSSQRSTKTDDACETGPLETDLHTESTELPSETPSSTIEPSRLIVKLVLPPGYSLSEDMAPVRDPNNVDVSIKEVVQNLYDVQTQIHGFEPVTQPLLVDNMTKLAHSLSHLQTITSPTQSPNNPVHQIRIAPEIIDYVDDGRNPDIFTRDFVELVVRGNAVINGKQQAFRDFSQIFANALKVGIEGISEDVDRIMKNAGLSDEQGPKKEEQENGTTKS